jgi:hypothetical protein
MTSDRARLRSAIFAGLVCVLPAMRAAAQDDGPAMLVDTWANVVASSTAPRWIGPRVPWPEPAPRPPVGGIARSPLYPVNVQAASVRANADLVLDALGALERAHAWLEDHDWPVPVSDGGEGDTPGFDLYLVDDAGDHALGRAVCDEPLLWGGLDGSTTHALLDVDVDREHLEACVVSTYVAASLLGLDPAEAPSWRRATGDYVAWLTTGHFGCSDDGIARHQEESWRTWIGNDPESGPGGALFLAMLSARTDGLSGDFIRDLWSGAPQLTWEGYDLRAAPDMWQVVNRVMEVGRDPLRNLLEEMAVARYFAGTPDRIAHAPIPLLRELPPDAAVPISGHAAWSDLPRRFEPHDLELEPYGSAYAIIDTTNAPAGSVLRIWLRGEHGVGWALAAVRLAADGTELGRVRAPVRPRNPHSYIPLELARGDTANVVLTVTNLGTRLVDADEPDDQVRSFELIVDKTEPGH